MMGRETTKEVSPFYEYYRKKSEWKESGLEALDLFCPTYLEFGRLVFASLGLKPPTGVCRERYHSLNLSTGCANLVKFHIPVLNDLTSLSYWPAICWHQHENYSGCPMRGRVEDG